MHEEFLKNVVHEWYDPLYRFAVSLCQNPDDALDLTQSTFYKLSSKIEKLKDRSKVKSWMFSVLYREFIDQYRHRRRYPTTTLEFVPEQKSESSDKPGNHMDAAEVVEVLSQMDEKFRAPLALFYLEHFSYKEIAELLDVPIGTVMSRLRRGKDHLRKRFENKRALYGSQSSPIPFPKEATHE